MISADMLASLPGTVSPMLLNGKSLPSDEIAMISHFLTHLNPSSSKNLILAISDLTCLDMGLGDTIIYYIYRFCSL